MYDINLNNYSSGMAIGVPSSGSGNINLVLHKTTNTFVVIKKYFIDDKEPEDFNLVEQEIVTTRQLQHPNVLPYLSAFVSGHDVYVTSPLMSYGSCSDLIREHFQEGFPEIAVAFIIKDVLHGLDYIHKKGIIHRALKASHILISEHGQVCICGMRYSCKVMKSGKWQRTLYAFPKSSTNNLKWLSPEILQQDLRGYNEKSDIYSLGITICELANGTIPFAGLPDTLMLTEKVRRCIPQIMDRSTFPVDVMDIEQSGGEASNENSLKKAEIMSTRKFSESFHELAEFCLQCDPSDRPSIARLLAHSFFKQCRKSDTTLLDILKPIKPLHQRFVENFEDQAAALSTEFVNLELESCQWDFENT
ncbi:STE20-related kinase adapter protein alpha [Copidosoma floridanum]|uniref:STE20-related kinase adapter protein alpha n=1 Tax=Copidosoma floridanum TaxID=29053 RepID=UPI0006C9A70B|nr:STE20-related kinase adapter protein alpha [Copidosoma floridanum]